MISLHEADVASLAADLRRVMYICSCGIRFNCNTCRLAVEVQSSCTVNSLLCS